MVCSTMEQNLSCTVVEESVENIRQDVQQTSKRQKISRVTDEVGDNTTLNEKQQKLFDYLTQTKSFAPVFVSGSAGTGKSALLVALREHWLKQDKIVFVAAYTHLAARNINGKTCHSLFRFDFELNLLRAQIGVPHYLIIDEISMVPEKMLDGIDSRLRQTSGKFSLPFGGVNVVVFGDLYQIPPVDKHHLLPPYKADIWYYFELYELTENMRQSEPEFIANLNMLRVGDVKCLSYFNRFVVNAETQNIQDCVNCTSLVSTHKEANDLNKKCYAHIIGDGEEMVCTVKETKGRWNRDMVVFNEEQAQLIFGESIKVCVGARVMITHTTDTFCNGDLGVVRSFNENEIVVVREHDNKIGVLRPKCLTFNTKTLGVVTFVTGFPIAYGWAVTIHKAQGMTIKNLTVYPACIFAPGQAYVALSRAVHSSGLTLATPITRNALNNMEHIREVYEYMKLLCL
uniref:DNA helicase 2 n=1 Tax=Erinnyis ello granulovirus TaxID=307444 RepID=A0A288WIU3_9BBAC|nr:DNA helicase 2 [Erinnyis ello granulovirus]